MILVNKLIAFVSRTFSYIKRILDTIDLIALF